MTCKIYSWADKDLPSVDMGSNEVLWWDEDEICIKIREPRDDC